MTKKKQTKPSSTEEQKRKLVDELTVRGSSASGCIQLSVFEPVNGGEKEVVHNCFNLQEDGKTATHLQFCLSMKGIQNLHAGYEQLLRSAGMLTQ